MKKNFLQLLGLICAIGLALNGSVHAQMDSIKQFNTRFDNLRLRGFPLTHTRLWGIQRVSVINMIPNAQSDETGQDSEPNLAVDPADTRHIVGSAFTSNPSGSTATAPVFISSNGGYSWAMSNIVPSGNGSTGDISLDFARQQNRLYAGILRGGSFLRQMVLRSANPFNGTMMETLTDHSTEQLDQPYVSATSISGTDLDRVYVGFNEYDNRTSAGGDGRTASAEFSLDARATPPPAGFTTTRVEARTTAQQDMPATRFAVHPSGIVYGVFYRWASGALPSASCDVIVVRDDNFASGTTPFTALTDPSDGVAGRIVVGGRTVPAFPASLGANRLVASNLSIAVHPTCNNIVYIAWADRVGTTDYTLHMRRSTNSGVTWSGDLVTITNATNPALAVNTSGVVGFLYQQLTGSGTNLRWQTHIQRSSDGTNWSDLTLADTPDNNPAPLFQPYIGDYCDLIAVGQDFFGIFSASNIPDMTNFPQGVRYQRNADFTTNRLRNVANTANVSVSIDPFFFKISRLTIIDHCLLWPNACSVITMDRNKIHIVVDRIPVQAIDPIPKNCLVKWDCPGCGQTVLCPPFYNIFIDEIDPLEWNVRIFSGDGEPVRYQFHEVSNGIVLTFRPSKEFFKEGQIGDYYLSFESVGKLSRKEYTFDTRLEVSDYSFAEYLKRK